MARYIFAAFMKVSIITVTYNAEKYLASCIQSVQEQTYPDIEHILVDGKSSDNTLKIVDEYRDAFAHVISETDRGMYDAINKGINVASGTIVGILNSDDMYASPDVIASVVDAFNTHQTDSVYGDLMYVDKHDTSRVLRVWNGKPYKRSRFRAGWMPAHPTFFIRRSLINEFGGYENHFFTAADYEFMARYLWQHRISAYYLPKLITKMRAGGQSNGNLYRRLRANRRDYLAMKKINIPFPFFVSILKPLMKLHQYRKKINVRIF